MTAVTVFCSPLAMVVVLWEVDVKGVVCVVDVDDGDDEVVEEVMEDELEAVEDDPEDEDEEGEEEDNDVEVDAEEDRVVEDGEFVDV